VLTYPPPPAFARVLDHGREKFRDTTEQIHRFQTPIALPASFQLLFRSQVYKSGAVFMVWGCLFGPYPGPCIHMELLLDPLNEIGRWVFLVLQARVSAPVDVQPIGHILLRKT
jgi:hypothetical protein